MLSNPSLFPRGPPDLHHPPVPFDNPYLTSPVGTQPPAQQHNSLLPLAPRPAGSIPGGYNDTLGSGTNFSPVVSGHETNQLGDLARGQQSDADSPDGPELTVPVSDHKPSLTREPVLPSNPTYNSDGFYQGRAYGPVDQLHHLNQDRTHSPSAYTKDSNGEKGLPNSMETQEDAPPVQSPVDAQVR